MVIGIPRRSTRDAERSHLRESQTLMQVEESFLSVIRSELSHGEVVLWADRPDPQRVMIQTLPLMGCGIAWTAGVLPIIMMQVFAFGSVSDRTDINSSSKFNWSAILFGIPFIAVGIAMTISPFWQRWQARHTVYALTDERIIIIRGTFKRSVKSFQPAQVEIFERVERGDGSGDLTVAKETYKDSDGHNQVSNVVLIGIKEVRKVEELIRKTLKPRDVG